MSGDYRYPACDVSAATFAAIDREREALYRERAAARDKKQAEDDINAAAAVAPCRVMREYGPERQRQVFSDDVLYSTPGLRSVVYTVVGGKVRWDYYIEPVAIATYEG